MKLFCKIKIVRQLNDFKSFTCYHMIAAFGKMTLCIEQRIFKARSIYQTHVKVVFICFVYVGQHLSTYLCNKYCCKSKF